MRKFELSITPSYVPSWGIVEAVRELFQNALDQEKQHPDNTMHWSYDEATQQLTISNKSSVLEASSLLLGQTTKADDESTIGQFGEGYKIATLVLLREGKNVTFYNYGKKEIWRPRFVNSRRYGTQILTFFVETLKVWNKVPDNNLTIVIEGITTHEFHKYIVPSNLYMRKDFKILESTPYGDILDIPGQVFVNGLFVCNFKPYKHSYNFKPGRIKLDRDRKMASDFDLRWQASKLWSVATDTDHITQLLSDGAADVAYLKDVSALTPSMDKFSDAAFKKFMATFGAKAVPISTQDELSTVPEGYKAVVVPETYKRVIRASTQWQQYQAELDQHKETKYDRILKRVDNIENLLIDLGAEIKLRCNADATVGIYKILNDVSEAVSDLREDIENTEDTNESDDDLF